MSGPGVQLLQYLLAIVGEFYDALPRWQAGQIDGIFGPQTREAVAAYQRLVGLPITGVVDRETWYSLLSTYQSVLLAQPEQQDLTEDSLRGAMPSGVCSYCVGETRVGSAYQQGVVGKIDFHS